MGAAGSSTEEILEAFYPGTSLGEAGGNVEVSVASQPAVEIALPSGGLLVDALSGAPSPGFPVTVSPGGSVAVSIDGGRYRVAPLAGAVPEPLPPPPPVTTVPDTPEAPPAPAPDPELTSSGPLWAVPAEDTTTEVGGAGRYRGVLRLEGGDGGLEVVNQVDVEDYLRGMGEIRDPGWPAAALGAQAVAARTYAVRAIRAGGTLCPDDRCQVYLGVTAEYPAMDRAVAATAGQVLLYGGSLAQTVYSASGGGVSASPEEGFGDSGTAYPYLRVAPYPTADPQPWTLRSSLTEMAGRFGYRGAVTDSTVSRTGPSGRALEVTFQGESGPLAVDIHRFSSELNLRSTLFTLRVERPPPPPVAGSQSADGFRQVQIASPPPAVVLYGEPPAGRRGPWIVLAFLTLLGGGAAVHRARRSLPSPGTEG